MQGQRLNCTWLLSAQGRAAGFAQLRCRKRAAVLTLGLDGIRHGALMVLGIHGSNLFDIGKVVVRSRMTMARLRLDADSAQVLEGVLLVDGAQVVASAGDAREAMETFHLRHAPAAQYEPAERDVPEFPETVSDEVREQADLAAEEMTEEAVDMAAEEMTEEAVDMAAEEMTDEVVDMVAEEMIDEVGDMAAEEMTDEMGDMAAEEMTEEAVDMAAEETADEVGDMAPEEMMGEAAVAAPVDVTEAVNPAPIEGAEEVVPQPADVPADPLKVSAKSDAVAGEPPLPREVLTYLPAGEAVAASSPLEGELAMGQWQQITPLDNTLSPYFIGRLVIASQRLLAVVVPERDRKRYPALGGGAGVQSGYAFYLFDLDSGRPLAAL